ncbi:MAG: FAD-dependent oxidoreductase [Myxococcales bacterium]|nr:FAD-dependent oxidoreductase [Myxococcales bacterium]
MQVTPTTCEHSPSKASTTTPSQGSGCPVPHGAVDALHFDAVVVGGGIAGSTTAAALADRGFKVLVCEAGLPSTKRLAGELMHPPGAAELEALGLLEPLKAAGGVPVYGFAIFQTAADPGTVLSYSEIPGGRPIGIALEHAVLTRTLFEATRARPNVTVWEGARVLGATPSVGGSVDGGNPLLPSDEGSPSMVAVRVGESVRHVTARLIVSAEGRSSKLREDAGIQTHDDAPFRMVGWAIEGGRLPYPGYGHVFTGGPTPVLAYQVSKNAVRIMFELGMEESTDIGPELLSALPEPFRSDVVRAMAESPKATARFQGFRTDRVVANNLAVVGDAGGCVHPLTASGMSFCIADAVRLAASLKDPAAPLLAGLKTYETARSGPMRTRAALGPAMVEALCSNEPSMRLLRHGLFRYWTGSPRGRGASMGLLSTREDSMTVMAREYAIVCAHALVGVGTGAVARSEAVPAIRGLARRTAELARGVMPSRGELGARARGALRKMGMSA